jgi:uncharacterized protein (TIGR02186 family)
MGHRRPAFAFLVALAGLVAGAPKASAERLVTSLSNHRVMVTSNFTGDELVLFGAVEHDAATQPRRGGYDIVVTVTGPRQSLITYRKSRVLGIWVNAESRVFENVPSYLSVLANRPLDAITSSDILRRQQLGLDNVPLPQRDRPDTAVAREDPFRAAFLRLEREHQLYREESNAVTMLTPTLFRASIPLPAEVPIGNYQIDVRLFADGAQIARAASAFEVYKAGFEQVVTSAARDHGFLYGLGTAAMALVTGWFAAVIFRRD